MPRFSSYPTAASLASADTFLVHQSSSNTEKQVTATTVSTFVASVAASTPVATIAALKALVVTDIPDGASRIVLGYYSDVDDGGGIFVYEQASVLADNGGTVIAPTAGAGRWIRPAQPVFNVVQFGAKGDGSTNDTTAIQSALTAAVAQREGSVYIPAGNYNINATLTATVPVTNNLSIFGDGGNVSVITQTAIGQGGFDLNFTNDGVQQPSRVSIKSLGLYAGALAGTAIDIDYGNPVSTSTHFNDGPRIEGVVAKSNAAGGAWATGLILTSAWNSRVSNSNFSGNYQGGVWANLTGDGIILRRACNNSHFDNIQVNFFRTGIWFDPVGTGVGDPNSEGLHFTNCSLVGVRLGVAIMGNGNAASPTVPAFIWNGGLIELRAAIYGIQLQVVTLSSITNALILPEAPAGTAIFLDRCSSIVVSGNTFSGMDYGVVTSGVCSNINVKDNISIAGNAQVTFSSSTSLSRSGGNVVSGAPIQEIDGGTTNRIYNGCGYSGRLYLTSNFAVANATETDVTWAAAKDNGTADLAASYFFNAGTPTLLLLPASINYIRITAGVSWGNSTTGSRSIKVKGNPGALNLAMSCHPTTTGMTTSGQSNQTVTSPILNVKALGITGIYLVVEQTSGGSLDVRSDSGTSSASWIGIEVLG